VLEWCINEVATYRDFIKLGKSQTQECQVVMKLFVREYTKIFLACFILDASVTTQDYVLSALIEHSQSGKQPELYNRFDSADQCLKAC
jgi:hypothetical protein